MHQHNCFVVLIIDAAGVFFFGGVLHKNGRKSAEQTGGESENWGPIVDCNAEPFYRGVAVGTVMMPMGRQTSHVVLGPFI